MSYGKIKRFLEGPLVPNEGVKVIIIIIIKVMLFKISSYIIDLSKKSNQLASSSTRGFYFSCFITQTIHASKMQAPSFNSGHFFFCNNKALCLQYIIYLKTKTNARI